MKGLIGLRRKISATNLTSICYLFLNDISLALDFRTFVDNMKMSSSLSKILEPGINVFKRNCQIMKNKKYDILTTYECDEKLSMIFGCNIWMICLELNWFFLRSKLNIATFWIYGRRVHKFRSISRFKQFSFCRRSR